VYLGLFFIELLREIAVCAVGWVGQANTLSVFLFSVFWFLFLVAAARRHCSLQRPPRTSRPALRDSGAVHSRLGFSAKKVWAQTASPPPSCAQGFGGQAGHQGKISEGNFAPSKALFKKGSR